MDKKIISTNNAPAAIGPYSQAIEANGFIFTSGQIAINPADGTIPEGVEAQTVQVLENISHLLEAAGSGMDKVIKTVVFIKDMNDFATINGIYARYFPEGACPARSCVEVARLPKDVLLEIETVAVK